MSFGGAEGTEERFLQSCLDSLDQSTAKAGYMVRSMRLIPKNKVGQACESVRLLRLPREACLDQDRCQSGERHSDTQS